MLDTYSFRFDTDGEDRLDRNNPTIFAGPIPRSVIAMPGAPKNAYFTSQENAIEAVKKLKEENRLVECEVSRINTPYEIKFDIDQIEMVIERFTEDKDKLSPYITKWQEENAGNSNKLLFLRDSDGHWGVISANFCYVSEKFADKLETNETIDRQEMLNIVHDLVN